MRASCENCGKLGDMTPGKPYVCGVCGHFHDLPLVDSRIAAAKRESKAKAEEESIAIAKRKAAREHLMGTIRPRPDAYKEPLKYPSPDPLRMPFSRSTSSRGSCFWKMIKIIIAIAIFTCVIKSCVFDVQQSSRKTQKYKQQPGSEEPIRNPPNNRQPSKQQYNRQDTEPVNPTQSNVCSITNDIMPINRPLPPLNTPKRQFEDQNWRPGAKHQKWPHIYASETPGTWVLEKGYELVYPGTDDWSVRKIVEYVRCAKCSGTGITKTFFKCSGCNGRRTVLVAAPEVNRRSGKLQMKNRRVPCSACQGRGGTHVDGVCPKCKGARVVPKSAR